MKPLTIEQIVHATGGILNSGDASVEISGICTDTRKIEKGCLFVPIAGDNYDGHDFINEAIAGGAIAVLFHKEHFTYDNIVSIKVDNTTVAYGNIAKYYRSLFQIPVVAITGSVGKTTTKDMTACAFSGSKTFVKTPANHNNEIGLPTTIFEIENQDAAIVEMGMRGLGQIEYLSKIAAPTIGIITNIGSSHMELLGSKENIFKAKMEICKGMNNHSTLLLNGDDAMLTSDVARDMTKTIKVLYFGTSDICTFRAVDIIDADLCKYKLITPYGEATVKLQVAGTHNIINSLAAIGAALCGGVAFLDAVRGIEQYGPESIRQKIIEYNNIKIIDDTYNASPESMKASLNVLMHLVGTRKIAVLGNIFELGNFAEKAHRDVGNFISRLGLDFLVTVGNDASYIADEAITLDFNTEKIYKCNNTDEATIILRQIIKSGDVVLIKGSRAMKMELIVAALTDKNGGKYL